MKAQVHKSRNISNNPKIPFIAVLGKSKPFYAYNSYLREIRKKPIEFEVQDENFLDQKGIILVQIRLVKLVVFVSIERLNAYRYFCIKEGGSANSQINIISTYM